MSARKLPPCTRVVTGRDGPAGGAQVDEDTAALLLPAVAAGIGGGASADFRAAAFMVASQLAARAPLAPSFLDGAGPAAARASLPTCTAL